MQKLYSAAKSCTKEISEIFKNTIYLFKSQGTTWALLAFFRGVLEENIQIKRHYLNWDLILSWRSSLSYRSQSTDLLYKLLNWFLYDRYHCHERVNKCIWKTFQKFKYQIFPLVFKQITLSLTYDKLKHWHDNLPTLACEFNQILNYVSEKFTVTKLRRSGKDMLTKFILYCLFWIGI